MLLLLLLLLLLVKINHTLRIHLLLHSHSYLSHLSLRWNHLTGQRWPYLRHSWLASLEHSLLLRWNKSIFGLSIRNLLLSLRELLIKHIHWRLLAHLRKHWRILHDGRWPNLSRRLINKLRIRWLLLSWLERLTIYIWLLLLLSTDSRILSRNL